MWPQGSLWPPSLKLKWTLRTGQNRATRFMGAHLRSSDVKPSGHANVFIIYHFRAVQRWALQKIHGVQTDKQKPTISKTYQITAIHTTPFLFESTTLPKSSKALRASCKSLLLDTVQKRDGKWWQCQARGWATTAEETGHTVLAPTVTHRNIWPNWNKLK